MFTFAKRMEKLEASGIRKLFEMGLKMRNPIDLSLGQPDFDVPDTVKQAAIGAILAGKNRYTPTAGLPELRTALARKLQAEGIATAEQNLVTSGASGGLLLALMTLADSSSDVYMADPYFITYPQLIRLTEAEAVPVSTYPDFHLTPERLERAVHERETRLLTSGQSPDRRKILIFNYPNNPTGATYTEEQLKALAQKSRELGFQVISDEVYDIFSYDYPHVSWLKFDPEAILVRAFSKTGGMPGWRVGYSCAPEPILKQLLKMQQFSYVCINTPAQWACLKLLETDLSHITKEYRRRRDLLMEKTRGFFEIPKPEGAFYAFVRYPIADGDRFIQKCIERELLVVPGGSFSEQNTHFRLSFSVSPAVLDKGLALLTEIAKELKAGP